MVLANIDVAAVRALKDLRLAEENHTNPTEKPTINANNWPKTLEEIEEYLRNHLSQTKIPLAYIVRRNEEVPNHNGDPQANYPIIQDEMIRRATHRDDARNYTPLYNVDNRRVWNLIQN